MKSKGYRPKKEFTMKQKLAGTALCLLLYRVLSFVPLPFVDSSYIQAAIGMNGSLGLLNVLSGGNLGNMSFMALGIGPWITASIILQLGGIVFPSIADMNKDADGKKKYRRITFILSAVFAFVESIGIMAGYGKAGWLLGNSWYHILIPAFLMMCGTGILSLMGWYIDERLFGNGTSLILTTGILCSYVNDGLVFGVVLTHGKGMVTALLLCIAAFVALFYLFAYAVFISSCEKRIPVVYSNKMPVRMKSMGNSVTSIPMKLMAGGVVPVIFASTIVTFPAFIGTALGLDAAWLAIFNTSCWLDIHRPWASIGLVLYILLIIGFSYFCQLMYMNPVELANDLQKNGGTIPGIRAGKPTADHIKNQAKWLTMLGGIFLCVLVTIPIVVSSIFSVSNVSFFGTSLLITVATIDESWKALMTWRKSKSYGSKGMVTKGIFRER